MELTLGVVKNNYDADHPGMVQVTLPEFIKANSETAWLPVASPYAGKNYGLYVLPEKDAMVIVGFLGGDVHSGVVLGSLWNKKNTLPAKTADEENTTRSFITKAGHKIIIKDGDEGFIKVTSKEGHKIDISDKDKKMTIATSDGKQSVLLDENSGAITVSADKKITLKATDISIEGKVTAKGQTVAIESEGKLDIKGKQLNAEGSTLKLKGQNAEFTGANVKVESSGILTLKGSMAKIN